MKKLLKTILLVTAFSLVAGNGWALSIAEKDLVIMTAPEDGENYKMHYDINNNGQYDAYFDTFCLEKYETFNQNGQYRVDSIGMVAFNGGIDLDSDNGDGDPVSDEAVWLYASYFDGVFDSIGSRGHQLAGRLQNAIWFAEDEITDNADYNFFTRIGFGLTEVTNFSVTGWDIQVVNLVNIVGGASRQSQLVGAPVPEPATMLLFGTGLIGLAGVARRRSKKKA